MTLYFMPSPLIKKPWSVGLGIHVSYHGDRRDACARRNQQDFFTSTPISNTVHSIRCGNRSCSMDISFPRPLLPQRSQQYSSQILSDRQSQIQSPIPSFSIPKNLEAMVASRVISSRRYKAPHQATSPVLILIGNLCERQPTARTLADPAGSSSAGDALLTVAWAAVNHPFIPLE